MKIFISYRRSDSEGHAGRLFDSLKRAYKSSKIFMDVDSIDVGKDWLREINESIAQVDVVLCVIGKTWIDLTEKGTRRLDDPEDPVRNELESALSRSVPIIPVLVNGAIMPRPEVLPNSVAAICRVNAHTMRHSDWDNDIDKLKVAIKNEIARSRQKGASQLGRSLPRMSGTEIFTRWLNDNHAPRLMGRNGGLEGKYLTEDLRTGRWKIQLYDVANQDGDPPPNWLLVEKFIERIAPTALLKPQVLKKREKAMTGQEISDSFSRGDAPLLMSRGGGLEGKLLHNDLHSGSWLEQKFVVSDSDIEPPKNWFFVKDFVQLVQSIEPIETADRSVR